MIFRAFFISLIGLAACNPVVGAQETPPIETDGLTKIAERDLRELKAMLPGLYDNQEQVYFQDNLDLPEAKKVPRLTLTITPAGDDFKATTLNPETGETTEAVLSYNIKDGAIHSTETRNGEVDCQRVFTRGLDHYRGEGCGSPVMASQTGFIFGDINAPFKMRRARPFKCWISPRKEDGSYAFYNNIALHDQGGRAWLEGEDHPRVGLKMRNVVWPSGNNRPSLVLYAYRGEDADKAVSYAWTSPHGERLAINLRWMQASCTLGDTSITPGINLKTGAGQ